MMYYRVGCVSPGEATKALRQRAVWCHRAQGKRREVHHKPPKHKRKKGYRMYVPILSWRRLGGVEGFGAIKNADLANEMACCKKRSSRKKE